MCGEGEFAARTNSITMDRRSLKGAPIGHWRIPRRQARASRDRRAGAIDTSALLRLLVIRGLALARLDPERSTLATGHFGSPGTASPRSNEVAFEEAEEDIELIDLGLDALLIDDRHRIGPGQHVEQIRRDVEMIRNGVVEAEDDGAEAVILLHRIVKEKKF